MTGLNHAATGALVAAAFNRPLLSIPAALLSHFVADMVPHWNYVIPRNVGRRQLVMLSDLTLSLALLLFLAVTVDANPYLVIAGGLLGILPDTMWLRFFINGRPSITGSPKRFINRIRKFHLWIQWSETTRGLLVEVIWFPIVLWLIYQIHH